MTSCRIFNCPMLNCVKPMRLAGTCSRYSNSATPQLTRAAVYQGVLARFFRWPYQAKVMKTLLAISSRTVCAGTGRDCRAFIRVSSAVLKKY